MYSYPTKQLPSIDEITRKGSTVYMYDNTSVFGITLRKELAMATLKKRRKKWYARVLWYDNTGIRKEKQVPLRTESMVEARSRLSQVEKHRNEIVELSRNGENYNFPWMNDDGILKIDVFTFQDAIDEWIGLRRSQGIADSTINRNRCSMNTFTDILGQNIRLSDITTKSIEVYTDTMQKRKHGKQERRYKPNGININLRTLRTFLNWSVRRNYIDSLPYFSMVKTDKSLPSYISDSDFAKIMGLDWLDDHHRKAFQLFRDTGCRLSEPFIGELSGTVLVIPAKYSKSRMEKEIEIDIQYLPTLLEMQDAYQSWIKKVNKPVLKYFTEKYSKVFKECCRTIGIDRRFHDLRHTFAVRRYLITRDIYQVMKEMGHSKVTTTQIYSKFNTRRLEADFPTLVQSYHKTTKMGIVDTEMVDTKVVYSS